MIEEKPDRGEKQEAPKWLIDNIAEASKNTRKIYLLYLGFLAYCALTVISTTDRTLVLNEPAHLPIVNVGVPLEGFFIFAPMLAIMTFVYLQFYLQNLNGMKSELEDNYTVVNKKRIYPWIVNLLDYPQPGFVGFLQKFVVRFALWWTLPAVLVIFAFFYVKKHNIVMSYYLGLLPLIGALLVVMFRLKYERAKFWEFIKKKKHRLLSVIILLVLEVFFLACIIPWSMRGNKIKFPGFRNYIDLSYQKLVTEPETDYEGLYWADFSGVHLEGSNLAYAILKRANLTNAQLDDAFLPAANFQEANLNSADLQGSYMLGINLQGADLTATNFENGKLMTGNLQQIKSYSAIFKKAKLWDVNFKKASLQSADFDSAALWGASFQGSFLLDASFKGAGLNNSNFDKAELTGANLQDAHLYNAKNLTIKQLSNVKTLYGAKLDSALLEQVKDQYPHLLEPPKEEEEE